MSLLPIFYGLIYTSAAFCIIWVSAETGFLNMDNINRATWYSSPIDHECLMDCPGVERTTIGEVSILNRNCSVECKGGATAHHRYSSERDYKKVPVWNPRTRVRSECLVGVLREEIFCATVSVRAGVRQWVMATGNQCQRRNFRYYLPRQQCDDVPHAEVGEESCKDACVHDPYARRQRYVTIDVMRQRAQFRVCYDGMVSESYRFGKRTSDARFHKLRGRFWHFCRAEMTPCSACFRWGNWTAVTPCTTSCGASGFLTYTRPCHIKDRTGLYGEKVTWNRISVSYCKAFFGGTNTKPEPCNRNIPCPQWTQWGPWIGCLYNGLTVSTKTDTVEPNPNVTISKPKCKPSRTRRDNVISINSTEQTPTDIFNSTIFQAYFSTTQPLNNISEPFKTSLKSSPQTLKGFKEGTRAYRTRLCYWSITSKAPKCEGNSTEYRMCDVKSPTADQGHPTIRPEASTRSGEIECAEDNSGEQNEVFIANTNDKVTQPSIVSTTESSLIGEPTTSSRTGLLSKRSDSKIKRNRNHTRVTDDGFTSVLKDYAPALIAGLLVFIVMLLIVLIGICGIRMMQKNRRTRYDVTSPSFSAGTMGSIPSGLVQGFSHVLGLRHGSGTFGRSETTLNGIKNASDALSGRGSCKSVSGAVNSHSVKNKTKQQQHLMAASLNGAAHSSNHTRQNSPRTRIQMRELGNRAVAASNMGSREPSASSLLSTSSSTPTSVHPNSCSLQPLPPIPTNQSPHPIGNDGSVFKRGTGRSASLNPMENDRNIFNTKPQPRAESVSGRVTGRPYGIGSEGPSTWQMKQKMGTRKASSSRGEASQSEAYCVHDCDANSCCEKIHDDSEVENEYWSVTRCFETGKESSNHNTPLRKNGEKQTYKRIQEEKGREGIRMSRLRSKPSLSEDEENLEVKMVDNVLYAVTTTACVHRSADEDENSLKGPPAMASESSVRPHLGSCGESTRVNDQRRLSSLGASNQRFYNTIDVEESKEEIDIESNVSNNDDDYDHLCDQFGGPFSTKGRAKYPGTMTSLHQLRHHDVMENNMARNPHEYECIEFDEDYENNELGTDTQEIEMDVKDVAIQKRARKNDYVIDPRDVNVA